MSQGKSKSFFDEVKKEITCSICEEQFSEIKEPRILNCFHTFCKSCLEGWLRQQSEGRVSCPLCRKITECPSGISSVQPNLFCKHLVEIVEAYGGRGREEFPHCSNCKESKPLKFYCSDCNCFLCEECTGFHKKWQDFKDHHIKEVGNFESSDAQDYARRANFCEQHKDENEKKKKIKYFCEQCEVCICRDCAILEHHDRDHHHLISIENGIEKEKGKIEVKLQKVKENRSCLTNHKEYVEKRKEKLNSSIDKATNEVHRLAEHCKMLIQQHEASVTVRLTREKTAISGCICRATGQFR